MDSFLSLEIEADPNMEALHWAQALKLRKTTYNIPFLPDPSLIHHISSHQADFQVPKVNHNITLSSCNAHNILFDSSVGRVRLTI